ncbi:MAG TPA: class I SAM-dependent methyltransferase [Sporichthyaceae bacterium]|nr:class I SAM-dependent methyltransferase [Sporichthyaceae bacterium]
MSVFDTLMPMQTTDSDGFVPEDEVLRAARARADVLGVAVPSPSAGAALRFLAALLDAHSVIEIGTGAGVSAVWMVRGMRPDGVLTSVDADPEHQRAAKQTFADAGLPANRTRLIAGHAGDVLPRLTDGGYDLMWVSGDPTDYAEHLREAPRLLRVGGVVAFADGQRATSRDGDPRSAAVRDIGRALLDSEQFAAVLLPIGTGILAGTKRPAR